MPWSNTKLIAKQKQTSFREFCVGLVELIGEIELPVDLDSSTIKELTADMDDIFNPMKQCLIDLYKQCRCHSLNSPICPITAMDVLGQHCYQLKRRKSGVDVKDVDLLEQIGIHIVNTYLREIKEKPQLQRSVVRLDWYRTRRKNSKL